jgi:hypothetical protein
MDDGAQLPRVTGREMKWEQLRLLHLATIWSALLITRTALNFALAAISGALAVVSDKLAGAHSKLLQASPLAKGHSLHSSVFEEFTT